MKKLLTILAFLFLAVPAFAETITLGAVAPCSNRTCFNVPNDADPAVVVDFVSASTTYSRLSVSIDGVLWDSGYRLANVTATTADGVLYDGAGNQITVSTLWTHTVRKINMGRAHYYIQIYTLISGTIVR